MKVLGEFVQREMDKATFLRTDSTGCQEMCSRESAMSWCWSSPPSSRRDPTLPPPRPHTHTHTHAVFTNLYVYFHRFPKKKPTATSQTHQDADKLLLFHPRGRDDPAPQLPFSLGQMRLPPPLAHLEGCCFFFFFFFPLRPSEVSRPHLLRASSVPSASVAGVALLLCANSALIQKLFYAVNRTCDREREVGGQRGVGGGEGGRQDNKLF